MSKKGGLLSGVGRWAPYLLIFLPAALAFLYVYSFGVNVVFGDEWGIAQLFEELYSRRLGIGDLWAQHGDHRILFPRIALLTLGVVTHFNSVAEMYLTLTCFLLSLIGLLIVFKDNVVKASSLFLFVPVAFVMFSFRQYENMLSGFQVAFGFVQAFSVLALCFLYLSRYERLRKFAFPTALASATVGTFSAAQGLFTWPVGLLQLLIGPLEKPTKKVMVGVWVSVGVVEWVVYFIGFGRPDRGSPLYYLLGHPSEGIEYFLTLLGGSLFWQETPAFFGGLLLVCLAVASLFLVYKDGKLGEYSFWVALLLFSFLILASITLGRVGYGTPHALSSKYASFSVLTVIGTYVILVKLVLERRSYLTVGSLGILSVLILLSIPLYYSEGIEKGKSIEAERGEMAFVLSTYESQPDEVFQKVYPRNPNRLKKIRGWARILDRHDYNVFSDRERNAARADTESVVAPALEQRSQGVEQEAGSDDL